jgi:RND family efflux transporter MFP subunit
MKIFCQISYLLLFGLLIQAPLFAQQSFPVGVAELHRETVQHTVQAYARVEERPQYLHFEIPGYLKKLYADVNQQVDAGQVLAELDTTEIDNQIRLIREAMDYAQKKLQRTHQLRKDEAASQEELDDWEHSYAVKELELQQLQDQHDKHFLHAPAAGMIDERLLDFAGAVTTTTPIFIFRGQDRPWRVTAELTQREVMQVQKGNSVRLVLPDTPTPDLQGIVIKIHPAQQNNLFPVEIELNSPPDSVQLKTSMQVKAHISTGRQYQAYNIPIGALLGVSDGQGRIFVVDQEHAKALNVKLRRLTNDSVMVEDDLSAYSRIIVRGQHYLVDGALLEIIE